MFALKYALMLAGLVLFGSTGALMAYDVYLSAQLRRLLEGSSARKATAVTVTPRAASTRRLVLASGAAERGMRR